MARQKKTLEAERQRFEDDFYDLAVEEQVALLQTLGTLHRLKKRQRPESPKDPTPAPVPLDETSMRWRPMPDYPNS